MGGLTFGGEGEQVKVGGGAELGDMRMCSSLSRSIAEKATGELGAGPTFECFCCTFHFTKVSSDELFANSLS